MGNHGDRHGTRNPSVATATVLRPESNGAGMTGLMYVPIVISILVLGAHFLRSGSLLVVVAAIGLVALLPLRRPWVARLTQTVLVLGALEWARTLLTLMISRLEAGEPYLRMALILGVVAAVSAGSALLFQSKRMRERYKLDGNDGPPIPAG